MEPPPTHQGDRVPELEGESLPLPHPPPAEDSEGVEEGKEGDAREVKVAPPPPPPPPIEGGEGVGMVEGEGGRGVEVPPPAPPKAPLGEAVGVPYVRFTCAAPFGVGVPKPPLEEEGVGDSEALLGEGSVEVEMEVEGVEEGANGEGVGVCDARAVGGIVAVVLKEGVGERVEREVVEKEGEEEAEGEGGRVVDGVLTPVLKGESVVEEEEVMH